MSRATKSWTGMWSAAEHSEGERPARWQVSRSFLVVLSLVATAAHAEVRWEDGAFVEYNQMGWTDGVDVKQYSVFDPRGASLEYGPDDMDKPRGGTELKPSLKGPLGSQLTITAKATNSEANWKGATYTASFTISAVVTRDGKSYPVTLPGQVHRVTAVWSPDARRILLSITKDDDADSTSFMVPGPFPRVQVLYPPKKPLDEKAITFVDGLAAKAGCVVSFAGEAKKARPASVIYFAKGNEAEAKALAAALPGGATTEPLSWETTANVVIAIGDSFHAP